MGKTIRAINLSRSENPRHSNKYGRGWRKKADRNTNRRIRQSLKTHGEYTKKS